MSAICYSLDQSKTFSSGNGLIIAHDLFKVCKFNQTDFVFQWITLQDGGAIDVTLGNPLLNLEEVEIVKFINTK